VNQYYYHAQFSIRLMFLARIVSKNLLPRIRTKQLLILTFYFSVSYAESRTACE
jgi:hypothetical protein